MHRTARRLAVVLAAIAVVPVAASNHAAGAIDQDLVVSAASGDPGTVIEVSSATCGEFDVPNAEGERYLRAILVSGTGADEVLAGAGSGPSEARLVVPDWIDPDDPAVIEASCVTVEYGWDTDTVTQEAYDPVAFDVLAGAGAPTQARTFSRTSLLTGQSFTVDGTGCDPASETFAGVDFLAGDDVTGRSLERLVASGGGSLADGGTFEVPVDLIEWSWGVGWATSSDNPRPHDIQIQEGQTDIPAGTYTALTFCGAYDEQTDLGTYLLLPPQLVEVTGSAPIGDLDFEAEAGSRDATLTGGSCTQGPVTGEIDANDLTKDPFDMVRHRVGDAVPSPLGLRLPGEPGTTGARALGDEEWVEFTATPDADGAWNHTESAAFDVGVLAGIATCGDRFADGFSYDVRLAVVDVPPSTTTTVTTTTTAVVSPAPATAVPGSPTYAG